MQKTFSEAALTDKRGALPDTSLEHLKAKVYAKVEYPFPVTNNQFQQRKTR